MDNAADFGSDDELLAVLLVSLGVDVAADPWGRLCGHATVPPVLHPQPVADDSENGKDDAGTDP